MFNPRWVQLPPNKSLQRSGEHKVLGRGRLVAAIEQVPLARVLTDQRAAAELSRYTADPSETDSSRVSLSAALHP